jgi:hypothetical protein
MAWDGGVTFRLHILEGQAMHLAPTVTNAFTYLSVAHGMHTPPFEPVYPGLHTHCLVSVLPFGDAELAGHEVDVAPPWHFSVFVVVVLVVVL